MLLLFVVGPKLAPARLWRLRHSIFLFGTSQILLCRLATQFVELIDPEPKREGR